MNNLSVSKIKFFHESKGVVTHGFNVERPKEGEEITSDFFVVSGWVVGKTSQAVEVDVLLSDEVLAVALINISRPDVEKFYPVDDAKPYGFKLDIPVVSLLGASELKLIAKLADGTKVPLANIFLEGQVEESAVEESVEVDSLSDQGRTPTGFFNRLKAKFGR